MLIFVVDDEKNVLEETKNCVQKAAPDAKIMSFNRGTKALEAIQEGSVPDALFTDIEMPGISGIDLAMRVKESSPSTRIIFTTGYKEYAIEAFKIKVQGYLLKPVTVSDVKSELEYQPVVIAGPPDKLVVRCFGHFDVFWHDEPVIFSRKQSKEVLAYLVDRGGASCTAGEISLALWQDESDNKAQQNRLRVLLSDLRSTLKQIGMEDVIIRQHRELAIRRDLIDCDYYRMMEGDIDAINQYSGKYMEDYSWAEAKNASIYFELNKNE